MLLGSAAAFALVPSYDDGAHPVFGESVRTYTQVPLDGGHGPPSLVPLTSIEVSPSNYLHVLGMHEESLIDDRMDEYQTGSESELKELWSKKSWEQKGGGANGANGAGYYGKGDLGYKHISKCGGSYLISLVKNMTRGHDRSTTEQHPLLPVDRQQEFVIASVRNPCDYYVSLWAYEENKWNSDPPHPDGLSSVLSRPFVRGEDSQKWRQQPTKGDWLHPPIFEPPISKAQIALGQQYSNRTTFRSFMEMSHLGTGAKHGVMSYRFWQTLIQKHRMQCWGEKVLTCTKSLKEYDAKVESDLAGFDFANLVDCWVYTETLDDDVHRCLKRYEEVSGNILDWKAWRSRSSSQNAAPHFQCHHFYRGKNQDLAAKVMALDGALGSKFKYHECCAAAADDRPLGKALTPLPTRFSTTTDSSQTHEHEGGHSGGQSTTADSSRPHKHEGGHSGGQKHHP